MPGDRTEGYVPDPSEYAGKTPSEAADEPGHNVIMIRCGDALEALPVVYAQADELNRQSRGWWWARVRPPDDPEGEHWTHVPDDVMRSGAPLTITWSSSVARDVNDWKGHDELQTGATWLISHAGEPVYGDDGGGRDPVAALRHITRKLEWLLGDEGRSRLKWDEPGWMQQLIGRPIYYRDQPAVIDHYIPTQGCLIMKAATPDGRFTPPAWWGTDSYDDDFVKDRVDSPHVWWWRDV